jgi:amidohydrolase
MIGEDFSYFLKEIPGFYYFYGSKCMVDGVYHAHHTEKFNINEENLYKVVYMNIMFILKFLSETKNG